MNKEERTNRKKALKKVRDMATNVETLTAMAKYYKTGEHIDMFEIGVCRGVSTRAFLAGLYDRVGCGTGHLYSVDITDRFNVIRNDKHKKNWTFIHGNSIKIDWDKEIDILMIDGSHKYEHVKSDFERYEPFVKKNGLIVMHDVTTTGRGFGVNKFWNEIKYQTKIILQYNSMGLGIIQKL